MIECGDSLVPLDTLNERILIDESSANLEWLEYPADFRVRSGLAERLALAIEKVPNHLGFLIKESLRPAAIQEKYFSNRINKVRAADPTLSEAEVIKEASKFVAPPSVAGHPTGGAIDLTLCTLDRVELNLGCAYDADEKKSNGSCYSFADGLPADVIQNREILFTSLESQGIINYPFEWWHWSYGDKYWAFVTGNATSKYSPI